MIVYYLQTANRFDEVITNVLRISDDGVVWTLGEGQNDIGYLAWVAEGNTAEEWTGN
jgi:hypothetical protein